MYTELNSVQKVCALFTLSCATDDISELLAVCIIAEHITKEYLKPFVVASILDVFEVK